MKILLEGRPGSGKTTVVARLAELLQERGVVVTGFVTHELRERGVRVGFEIETLDGRRATLAHTSFSGPPRVGKYGVDVEALETIVLPALEQSTCGGVLIIDELGKMELASKPFRDAVAKIFETDAVILATAHVFAHPFTDALKRRSDLERIRVTRASRDDLPEKLAERLQVVL